MTTRRYTIEYARMVKDHLAAIEAKYHGLIRDKIQEQLTYEPGVATANRKPLFQPLFPGAEWEIRCGPDNRFRVFYRIDEAAVMVHVAAVGEKERNVLRIGGEVFE